MHTSQTITSDVRGLTIEQVVFIHDYAQLVFDNGAILTIYNDWQHSGSKPADLIASKIQVVTTTKDAFSLILENGISLKVGLTDKDYIGPESMVLEGANGPIKIWS